LPPSTGYGYIEIGDRLDDEVPNAHRVVRFCEKPDLETARGFVEGGKHLWKGLAEIFPVSPGYDVEQLKQRFLYAQAIETARCLEENVIETSEDGDLGAVYGWGFPAWTGGTLSYIDTVGTATFVRECDRLAQKLGPRFAPSAWLRARAASGQGFY
jgi:3-hydroxyacyl-CoA dehydrogenase/enoyl-CoA hydratase/3-hydroxybutyryl-CoA epimerase